MRRPHHSERGFATIEVIISALIVVALLGGFVMFVTSTARQGSVAKTRVRQAVVAEAVWERLNASSSWTSTCPGVSGAWCAIPATLPGGINQAVKDLDTSTDDLRIEAKARGLDLLSDNYVPFGGGPAVDEDRPGVPDVYDLWVRVEHLAPAGAARSKPVVLTGTFDPSKIGQTGTLTVQICTIWPQVDERLRITACDGAPQRKEIVDPDEFSATADDELEAWDAARYMEINQAAWNISEYNYLDPYGPVGAKRPFTSLTIAHAGANVEVKIRNNKYGITKTARTDVNGRVSWSGLKPAVYSIEVPRRTDVDAAGPNYVGGADWAQWGAGSTPAGKEVTVQAGQESTAVRMYRPERKKTRVDVEQLDLGEGFVPENTELHFRLLPVPASRTTVGSINFLDPTYALYEGWYPIKPNRPNPQMYQHTGLYAPAVMMQKRNSPYGIKREDVAVEEANDDPEIYWDIEVDDGFVWIDPTGDVEKYLPGKENALSFDFCYVQCGDSIGGIAGA